MDIRVFPLLVTTEGARPQPGPGIVVAVHRSMTQPMVLLADIPGFNRGVDCTAALTTLMPYLWNGHFRASARLPSGVTWVELDQAGQFSRIFPSASNGLINEWRDLHFQPVGSNGTEQDFFSSHSHGGAQMLAAIRRHVGASKVPFSLRTNGKFTANSNDSRQKIISRA
jgi:hypothetical protein